MIINADCIKAMAEMDEASIDAIVTDPPYGLGFMGREWDDLPPGDEFATEARRVLKPGGHLLAFGGTRTYHRLACAIEDAGFEIRDCLAWLYGSGFPKSLDVSKAIDKAAGAERKVVGSRVTGAAMGGGPSAVDLGTGGTDFGSGQNEIDLTAPATPEAAQWQGWGTALKPAHEPIVLARKPLEGTVAANCQRYGTGAVNIDGTRVGQNPGYSYPNGPGGNSFSVAGEPDGSRTEPVESQGGRWPANVTLDPEAAAMLDEQSGEVKGQVGMTKTQGGHRFIEGDTESVQKFDHGQTDTGGASRFFYCAKASRGERNAGLEKFEERVAGGMAARQDGSLDGGIVHARNHHPTVKPIALMRWLCRLVTPPRGHDTRPFPWLRHHRLRCGPRGLQLHRHRA